MVSGIAEIEVWVGVPRAAGVLGFLGQVVGVK